MARRKRARTKKNFRYFFLNEKLHKVLKSSRVKDQIIAWSYLDKKRVLYSYAEVIKYMERAYSLKEVCFILDKHVVTVKDYIGEGKIRQPQKIYPIGNSESTKWSQYMFNQKDILELHDYILSSGRNTENLPTKTELLALLNHNVILYTKTSEGTFVPVWKAE